MSNIEVQIKEYEALKQEILYNQNRREQLFLYTITAFGIVWGFILRELMKETGSVIPFIIISFAPYFIIINFCHLGEYISGRIISIGTYILHFIESKHENNLHWETVWDDFAKGPEASKGYWYRFFQIASGGTCGSVIVITFFMSLTDKLGNLVFQQINIGNTAKWILIGLFAVFHCIALVWCIKACEKLRADTLGKRKRDEWNGRWCNVVSKLKSKGKF